MMVDAVDSHHVPSMEELGLVTPEERTPFKGGETVGLQRMAKHLEKKVAIYFNCMLSNE